MEKHQRKFIASSAVVWFVCADSGAQRARIPSCLLFGALGKYSVAPTQQDNSDRSSVAPSSAHRSAASSHALPCLSLRGSKALFSKSFRTCFRTLSAPQ